MLRLVQSIRCDYQITGGVTQSIFPETEKLLVSNTDFQKALRYVVSCSRMHRYRSMMDFLFCSIFPRWDKACQRFYEARGSELKDMITESQRLGYEQALIIGLELAHEKYLLKLKCGWPSFREEIIRLAA